MPNIKTEYFAGKPIKMNGLDGFVTEKLAKSASKKIVIKLKSQSTRQTIASDDLDEEEDQNEIQYTPAELKAIQKMGQQTGHTESTAASTAKKTTKGCCAARPKSTQV